MRRLVDFWIAVFVLLFIFVGVLHSLGAPEQPTLPQVAVVPSQPVGPTPPNAGGGWDGRIAPPDPALAEPSLWVPNASLPRVAADGRLPMRVYARPFDASDPRPRIGLLIVGLGVLETESRVAVETLPGPVSFAVSAYAQKVEPLLQAARDGGHELLVSIPMESSGFPLNDAGVRSLLTGASQDANQRNLEAVLGRIAGYVGATGASDGTRGERFVELGSGFRRVADELASRGLLYVDPRPLGSAAVQLDAPTLPFRAVDLVVDDPASRVEVEAKLAQLEQIARERGSALGLASALRPATLDRLAAWARTVEARGFVLAPVSALVSPPPARSGHRR